MQRWIVVALIGAILVGLGGGFGLWNYRQNRPRPVWVPLALNEKLPEEKRLELAKEIEKKLLEGDLLATAVKDVGFAKKRGFSSEAEALAEVRKLLFVEAGEADLKDGGKVPSVNIGFRAQRKSNAAYSELAVRIMKDVWRILGIKEPSEETI